MDQQFMLDCVYKQLAIDYNCSPDDFLKDGLIFTEAIAQEGRRPFPWRSPRIEMIAMGRCAVINASSDVMPFVRKHFTARTRDEVFYVPFFCDINPYFLPDIGKIVPAAKPEGFSYSIIEKNDIAELYKLKGFQNAMHNHPCPVELAVLARINNEIIGIAGASADCEMLWQIGVDVMTPFRGKGVAAAIVNMLTLEILSRGYIPYYGAAFNNIASQHVAVKAGYVPAWVHSRKTILDYKGLFGKIELIHRTLIMIKAWKGTKK
jgi:GNAT superfamily N-acetyltransferase